jgi:hypothetical protein
LNVVQGVGRGWMTLVRNLASDLGYLGIAALEAAKATAFMANQPAAVAGAEAGIQSLSNAIDELQRRNDRTEQSFLASQDVLQGFRDRARDLATQLDATRGRVVTLKDATDNGTDAWHQHTTAVVSATDAAKAQAEAEKTRLFWMKQADEAAVHGAALYRELMERMRQEASARAAVVGKAFLEEHDQQIALAEDAWQQQLAANKAAEQQSEADMARFFADLKAQHDAFVNGIASALLPIFSAIGNAGSTALRAMSGAIEGGIHLWQQYATAAKTAAAEAQLAWGVLTLGISTVVTAIADKFAYRSQMKNEIADLQDQIRQFGATPVDIGRTSIFNNYSVQIAKLKAQLQDLSAYQAQVTASLQEETDAREFLQATIEKYGITIEQLGPKWAQQQLIDQAQQLGKEYTALVTSGIDVGTVIEKMGANMSAFVQQAKATGAEVPEAMRPMLQKFVDAGQLVDETGQAITDLTGINFSMTLSEGFQKVIDKLQLLIDKITGDLGNALTNIPSPVIRPTVMPVTFTGPNVYDYNGSGAGQASTDESGLPSFARGGMIDAGSGRLAMLHGREVIWPVDDPAFDISGLVAAYSRQPGFRLSPSASMAAGAVSASPVSGSGVSGQATVVNVTVEPHFHGTLIDGATVRQLIRNPVWIQEGVQAIKDNVEGVRTRTADALGVS